MATKPLLRFYVDHDVFDYFESRRKRKFMGKTEFYTQLLMNSHMASNLEEIDDHIGESLEGLKSAVGGLQSDGKNVNSEELMRSIFFMESLLTIAMNKPETIRQATSAANQKLNALIGG